MSSSSIFAFPGVEEKPGETREAETTTVATVRGSSVRPVKAFSPKGACDPNLHTFCQVATWSKAKPQAVLLQ